MPPVAWTRLSMAFQVSLALVRIASKPYPGASAARLAWAPATDTNEMATLALTTLLDEVSNVR